MSVQVSFVAPGARAAAVLPPQSRAIPYVPARPTEKGDPMRVHVLILRRHETAAPLTTPPVPNPPPATSSPSARPVTPISLRPPTPRTIELSKDMSGLALVRSGLKVRPASDPPTNQPTSGPVEVEKTQLDRPAAVGVERAGSAHRTRLKTRPSSARLTGPGPKNCVLR